MCLLVYRLQQMFVSLFWWGNVVAANSDKGLSVTSVDHVTVLKRHAFCNFGHCGGDFPFISDHIFITLPLVSYNSITERSLCVFPLGQTTYVRKRLVHHVSTNLHFCGL